MKLTVQLPDEQYERLGGTQQDVQAQITKRLRLIADPIGLDDRLLIIDSHTRQELEQVLMRPLESGADLLWIVKSLASLKVGSLERQLSLDEAERLNAYAESMSLPLAQATKELLDPIIDELLMRV